MEKCQSRFPKNKKKEFWKEYEVAHPLTNEKGAVQNLQCNRMNKKSNGDR